MDHARIGDNFRHLQGYIPPALLSSRWREQLLKPLDCFPASLWTIIALESKLGEPARRCDVSFNQPRECCGELIEAVKKSPRLFDTRKGEPWHYILSFLERWNREDSLYNRYIDYLWYEFDIDAKTRERPVPFLLADLNNPAFSELDPDARFGILASLLKTLMGPGRSAGLQERLKDAVAGLPERARLNYLGIMYPRTMQRIRLTVGNMDDRELCRYLAARGLGKAARVLQQELQLIAGLAGERRLSFDVGPAADLLPGIEVHNRQLLSPGRQHGWAELLDTLIRRFPGYRKKCEALSDWVGKGWESLREGSGEASHYYIHRVLYHMKMVFTPGKPPAYKIYLFFLKRLQWRAS